MGFPAPRVASINASGHKYGLVLPGVGRTIWRDADALPEDLIFWVNYLGDNMLTFALNFSRPGAQVVTQYYNFLRLVFEGYRRVQQYARDVSTSLSAQRAGHHPQPGGVAVDTARVADDEDGQQRDEDRDQRPGASPFLS